MIFTQKGVLTPGIIGAANTEEHGGQETVQTDACYVTTGRTRHKEHSIAKLTAPGHADNVDENSHLPLIFVEVVGFRAAHRNERMQGCFRGKRAP